MRKILLLSLLILSFSFSVLAAHEPGLYEANKNNVPLRYGKGAENDIVARLDPGNPVNIVRIERRSLTNWNEWGLTDKNYWIFMDNLVRHTHSYKYNDPSSNHPHDSVGTCSCGLTQTKKYSGKYDGCSTCNPIVVPPQTNYEWGLVVVDNGDMPLNVRPTPSTEWLTIWTLPNRSYVKLYDYYSWGWYKVEFRPGDFGFVSSTYIQVMPAGFNPDNKIKTATETDTTPIPPESSPTPKDTDGDGFYDEIDEHPHRWDVSVRDLAIFAKLSYFSMAEYNNGLISDSTFDYNASINEVRNNWVMTWSEDNQVFVEAPSEEAYFRARTWYYTGAQKPEDTIIIIGFEGTNAGGISNYLSYTINEWHFDIDGYISMGVHPEEWYAKEYVNRMLNMYPDADIYLTGHSLGGYLSYISAAHLYDLGHKEKVRGIGNFNGMGIDPLTARAYRYFNNAENEDFIKMAEKALQYYASEGRITYQRVVGDLVSDTGKYFVAPIEYNRGIAKSLSDFLGLHDMNNFFLYVKQGYRTKDYHPTPSTAAVHVPPVPPENATRYTTVYSPPPPSPSIDSTHLPPPPSSQETPSIENTISDAPITENTGTDKDQREVNSIFVIGSSSVFNGRTGLTDTIDVPAQINNGRTMLPLRYLCEDILRGKVEFSQMLDRIDVKIKDITLVFYFNNPAVSINGTEMKLDTPPVIIDGRALLPLRAFDSIVSSIKWDGEKQQVIVTHPY